MVREGGRRRQVWRLRASSVTRKARSALSTPHRTRGGYVQHTTSDGKLGVKQ